MVAISFDWSDAWLFLGEGEVSEVVSMRSVGS